jgi:phosphoserine phosphatase RsbU/P
MSFPMRTKLVLAICLPLVLVYGLILIIEYRAGRHAAIAQMEQHLTQLALHEAARLDAELRTVAQLTRTTADVISLNPEWDGGPIEQVLSAEVLKNPKVFGMAVAFAPGMFRPGVAHFAPYVCRGAPGGALRTQNLTPADGYDYTRWDWYLLPRLLERGVWTDPYFDRGAGNILMCTYCAPFDRQGRFAGVVTADLSLEDLRRTLAHVRVPDGYGFVTSQAGTFISHPDESFIMSESVFSLAEWHKDPTLFETGRMMVAGKSGVRQGSDLETGEPRYLVFAPIASAAWSFGAVMPERTVLAPVRLRMWREMGLLVAGLMILVVIVIGVSIQVTRPIGRLAGVARELAGGNLNVQVTGITSRDEIGQFARTFNTMVTELKANVEQRLRETSARQAVESELKVATEIQLSLMPRTFPPFPERTEFDLHATYQPAKFMAGDYYDFFFVKENVLGVVIADVSGKGVPAAMFMAVVRTAIRNFTSPDRDPAEVLNAVNRALVPGNDKCMFVTLFYGHYNVRTGELVYSSAGHNPPYVLHGKEQFEALSSTGPILGVLPDARYNRATARLDPGDLLVLYTDGVTEASPGDGNLFGEPRLEALLLRLMDQPLKDICETIVREVDAYRHHERQDDVTLLVLRRNA